jgi:hypothetical protein
MMETPGKDPGDGRFDYYTGEHMLLREEPALVKKTLVDIGIDLNNFDIRVTGIYARPRPIGFDFYCENTDSLLRQVSANEKLRKDNTRELSGKFVALMAKGESFRQIGDGKAIHLIIALNGHCNVHVDSYGFVGDCGYDLNRMLGHGYLDLATDLLPGAFVSFGETGVAGLMAAPMKGVDGETRLVFGITGRW